MENTATTNRSISTRQIVASVKTQGINIQPYRFITPIKQAEKLEISEKEKEIQMARFAAFNKSFGNGSF